MFKIQFIGLNDIYILRYKHFFFPMMSHFWGTVWSSIRVLLKVTNKVTKFQFTPQPDALSPKIEFLWNPFSGFRDETFW